MIRIRDMRSTFWSWRDGTLAHASLLNMNMLREEGNLYRRDYALHDFVIQMVDHHLTVERREWGVPHHPLEYSDDPDCVLEAVAMDADRGRYRTYMFAWSAMNYTYAIPITVDTTQLAAAAGVGKTEYEAYAYHGLILLCHILWEHELISRDI